VSAAIEVDARGFKVVGEVDKRIHAGRKPTGCWKIPLFLREVLRNVIVVFHVSVREKVGWELTGVLRKSVDAEQRQYHEREYEFLHNDSFSWA
jgi:hypothetical protein